MKNSIFLGSDIFRGSVYGTGHPLNIARVWPVIDVCRALNWLDDSQYQEIAPASPEQLYAFHSPAYISALQEAESRQMLDLHKQKRHRIGLDGNPIFKQVYSRPATAAAASLKGAELLLDGQAFYVYNPAGGTHHGMPDRANGFCFVNDPALAILALIEGGAQRVGYIDIDAHHCDGVQDYLSSDPRIRLWSVHEKGRWPRTGADEDKGGGYARNFNLPRGSGDHALHEIMNQFIFPEVIDFSPDFIIFQAGCDGLAADPQSGLSYSNKGYWQVIEQMLALQRPALILGGGGYNPYTTARAWSGIWGLLTGHNPYLQKANQKVREILSTLNWQHRRGQNIPSQWIEQLYDE